MARGELFINGEDAYLSWGISLSDTALSALMTPPPVKAFTENSNRTQHGKRVLTSNPRWDSRDLTLQINMTAKSKQDFMSKYANFCDYVLKRGVINITTSYLAGVTYKCIYQSCTQFGQYRQEMALFTLRLTEPNPYDRTPVVEEASLNEEGGEV